MTARAEQDRKHSEHERDEQCRVGVPMRIRARRCAREHVDAHRDGRELQCDIRNDRRERDHRDQHRDAARPAEARRQTDRRSRWRSDVWRAAPGARRTSVRRSATPAGRHSRRCTAGRPVLRCPPRRRTSSSSRRRPARTRRSARGTRVVRIDLGAVAPPRDGKQAADVQQRNSQQRPTRDRRHAGLDDSPILGRVFRATSAGRDREQSRSPGLYRPGLRCSEGCPAAD